MRAPRLPPLSVPAVTAGWIDRLQLLEIELADRLELLGKLRSFEVGRQVVEPAAVFLLHRNERRHRCRPPLRSRQGWRRRSDADVLRSCWRSRCRQGLALSAQALAMPRLVLSLGHRFARPLRSG